jgi:hypothetical protein
MVWSVSYKIEVTRTLPNLYVQLSTMVFRIPTKVTEVSDSTDWFQEAFSSLNL